MLRVTIEVNASADMTWVVISDPIPGGATILGSGLGRDSQIATQGEKKSGAGWPAFEERSFEAFRSYYEYLPKGVVKMEYTVRLNNVGDFALPPSRVEAMYAPEMFGEIALLDGATRSASRAANSSRSRRAPKRSSSSGTAKLPVNCGNNGTEVNCCPS